MSQNINAQGQGNWWYFGDKAGIDFNSSPPVSVTGSLVTQEGCSSISDPNGNLLMYTDGSTVYCSSHTIMSNGTGLAGNFSTAQSAVIVKQPGNTNLYYIFTMGVSNVGSLNYSIVDMSLAAGYGSVTVKNSFLHANCLEKLTAVRHSNNQDIWILIHENSTSTNYVAYLLTSAGVNTTGVVSSVGGAGTNQSVGYLRASPNGMHVASAYYSGSQAVELYDFNATTGQLSNALLLTMSGSVYGVEFSPDGSMLYGSAGGQIAQWSICAGSPTAIAASKQTFTASNNWAMQLASDGKIYVSRYLQSSLGVINNPNAFGSAANYVDQQFSISPAQGRLGLPNYCTSWFMPPPSQFTVTMGTSSNVIGCMSASFTSPSTTSITIPGCTALTSSVTSILWNFGDPNSGGNNTTTQLHPIHMFSGLGTYTVSMILFFSNNVTDTLQQVLNINTPCISVKSSSITCATLGTATVTALGGLGPFSYTWTPSGQTGTVATGLHPGTYTIAVYDQGNNYTYTAQTIFTSLVPLTGVSSTQSSLTCFGASNGTATVNQLSGGSGSELFTWTNGVVTYTPSFVSTLSAGLWTVIVSDALTGCQVKEVFYITQPSSVSINIAASSFTACQGTKITFTASASGGTGPYNYQWAGNAPSQTLAVTQATGGSYVYSVNATDSYSCLSTNTIGINYINDPIFTVTNASICPLQTGTIHVSGATGYTWTGGVTGSSFAASPTLNTVYNFTGSALGCTNTGSGSIFLKSVPVPIVSSNSPRCNGQSLQLFAGGGSTYIWSGPLSYISPFQNPVLNPANPSQSGAYNVTVTGVNGCTASISHTVTIHPTPTVSALGDTICMQSTLNLFSSSVPGTFFQWSGPQGFTSALQNPVITNAQVNMTGYYNVKVTSAAGCTNVAATHASIVAKPVASFNTNSPRCAGQSLVLDASSTSGGISYQWSGPNGFAATAISNTIINVSVIEGGIYSLNVTTGPCITSIQKQVVVNPLPVLQLNSNSPVCDGKTLTVNADAPGFIIVGYVWQGPAAFYSVAKSPVINNVTSAAAGNYQVQVKDVNNCSSSGSLPVQIFPNPTLATVSTTVCLNASATITAEGAVSYNWMGPFLSVNQGSAAVIGNANYTLPQSYLVIGTAANGCTAIANATVSTRVLPVPTIVVLPDARVCRNETITLNAAGGLIYEWTGPQNIHLTGQRAELQMISTTYAGEYTLVATDAFECRGAATAVIEVDELPQGSLVETFTNHCVPYCSEFLYSNPNAYAPVKVQWQVENTKIGTRDFYHCFNHPGEYLVTGLFVDTTTTCKSSSAFNISVYAQPAADFEWDPKQPVEGGDDVKFINTTYPGNDISASWFFYDNANGEKKNINSSHIFKEAGTYPVALVVTSAEGCLDTIVKNVVIEPDFVIYIPNAFTPDDNDKNEYFMPVVRAVKMYDMKVFDRWGELLFSSVDPQHGWDGTFRGENCKADTYVYKIVLSTIKGDSKLYTGSVMLLR